MRDLGFRAAMREGSSPFSGTIFFLAEVIMEKVYKVPQLIPDYVISCCVVIIFGMPFFGMLFVVATPSFIEWIATGGRAVIIFLLSSILLGGAALNIFLNKLKI